MKLQSKSIRLRLVSENDAEFILKLRLDDKYNQFLSVVAPDLDSQKNWIKKYKKAELAKEEFYFVIERLDGVPCGTVRIYDLNKNSFCWGSWILNADKTRYAALESALLVYKFGFDSLECKKSHFEVMKENHKVISFHRKMGAVQTGFDDVNYYFEIDASTIKNMENRMARILK